jgi:hypothetical protein
MVSAQHDLCATAGLSDAASQPHAYFASCKSRDTKRTSARQLVHGALRGSHQKTTICLGSAYARQSQLDDSTEFVLGRFINVSPRQYLVAARLCSGDLNNVRNKTSKSVECASRVLVGGAIEFKGGAELLPRESKSSDGGLCGGGSKTESLLQIQMKGKAVVSAWFLNMTFNAIRYLTFGYFETIDEMREIMEAYYTHSLLVSVCFLLFSFFLPAYWPLSALLLIMTVSYALSIVAVRSDRRYSAGLYLIPLSSLYDIIFWSMVACVFFDSHPQISSSFFAVAIVSATFGIIVLWRMGANIVFFVRASKIIRER